MDVKLVVKTPYCTHLSDSVKNELKQRKLDLCHWKMHVHEENHLCWSVVLGYLLPYRRHDREFQQRLRNIATDTENLEEIGRSIAAYNPFLNRYACFFNEHTKLFVENFRQRLNEYICDTKNRADFLGFSNVTSDSDDVVKITEETLLQAASLILHCRIIMVYQPFHQKETIVFYPQSNLNEESVAVILYEECLNRKYKKVFSFGLTETLALKLQDLAFRRIMEKVSATEKKNYGKMYSKILQIPEIKKNFVISLLKSGEFDLVEKLYKQPVYILWKFADAGFVTDPCVKDSNGATAFIYALYSNNVKILYLLYDYATNDSRNSENTPRNPSQQVISNLKELKAILNNTVQELPKYFKEKNLITATASVEELIALNEFQLFVSNKLYNISNSENNSSLPDNIYEVKRRKKVVIEILSSYLKYFNGFHNINNKSILPFEVYQKQVRYFHNLDFYTALLFFDNLFALKEKLQLEQGEYEDIESSLLHFLFINKYYGQYVHRGPSRRRSLSGKRVKVPSQILLRLIYLERINIRKKISSFISTLCNTVIEENMCESLPESQLYTLQIFPQVKDEFILGRLKFYIELAVDDLHDDDDDDNIETRILVLERALHVLGESVKSDVKDSPTLAISFLSSSLPTDVARNLIRFRNLLCHPMPKQLRARLDYGKEIHLFNEIRGEINLIYSSLNHIYELQEIAIEQHVMEYGSDLIENQNVIPEETPSVESQKPIEQLNPFSALIDNDSGDGRFASNVEELSTSKSSQENEIDVDANTLKQYYDILQKRIDELKENTYSKSKTLANIYKSHLDNHYERIEEYLEEIDEKNEIKKDKDKEKKIQEVIQWLKNRFACLERLLKFVETQNAFKNPEHQKIWDSFDLPENSSLENIKPEARKRIENYKEGQCDIFKTLDPLLSKNLAEQFSFNCPYIQKLRQMLSECCFLTEANRNTVLSTIPEEWKVIASSKETLITSLKNKESLPSETLNSLFDNLKLKKKPLEELKSDYAEEVNHCNALCTLREIKDPYTNFAICLEKNELNKKELKNYDEKFNFSNDTKQILNNLIRGQCETEDLSLGYLYDRVVKLEKILIKSEEKINDLWSRAKGLKTKAYVKDRIIRCYVRQPEMQAAVEMLLFDCMVLLKAKRPELKHLWHKTEHLFNGINLRNVLAHGNPLFDAVGKILDPWDLPTEIITKVLELISDLEAIEAMHQLQQKTGAKFGKFLEIMKADECPEEYSEFIEKIKTCAKWEDYAFLIPREK